MFRLLEISKRGNWQGLRHRESIAYDCITLGFSALETVLKEDVLVADGQVRYTLYVESTNITFGQAVQLLRVTPTALLTYIDGAPKLLQESAIRTLRQHPTEWIEESRKQMTPSGKRKKGKGKNKQQKTEKVERLTITEIAELLQISHENASALVHTIGDSLNTQRIAKPTVDALAAMDDQQLAGALQFARVNNELVRERMRVQEERLQAKEAERKRREEEWQVELLRQIAQEEAEEAEMLAAYEVHKAKEADDVEQRLIAAGADKQRIAAPIRRHQPTRVELHIGPTNSGKTYNAFQALQQHGKGVYAAPLRFLAREAYHTLTAALGEGNVGLRTGEESLYSDADIICCTAEMAPKQGSMLVLDEVHWVADSSRGTAWTRLLCGGEYDYIHLIASSDAIPVLQAAFPDAILNEYERLGPLRYIGMISPKKVPAGSAVVAFSRKSVIALASMFHAAGRSVATLYGAMPIDARTRELARFINGEAEILCTTDVIGHGVNIPNLAAVVFAETNKYDGIQRRDLRPWEIAQIAGRAGRYGHTEVGSVYCLNGIEWLEAMPHLVKQGLSPDVQLQTGQSAYRSIERAWLQPTLHDLGCKKGDQLGMALRLWTWRASHGQMQDWLQIDTCDDQLRLFNTLGDALLRRLSLDDAWKLINAPCDQQHQDLFIQLARLVAQMQSSLKGLDEHRLRTDDLTEAEAFAAEVAVLRWFCLSFPDSCPYRAEEVAHLETAAADRVSVLLKREVQNGTIGRCSICSKPTAPWLQFCEQCYWNR